MHQLFIHPSSNCPHYSVSEACLNSQNGSKVECKPSLVHHAPDLHLVVLVSNLGPDTGSVTFLRDFCRSLIQKLCPMILTDYGHFVTNLF